MRSGSIETEAAIRLVKEWLAVISPEDRLEFISHNLMAEYCLHCGHKRRNRRCDCWDIE